MTWYEYKVDVGTSVCYGQLYLDDNVTDDEIRKAIMDDLYSVEYRKMLEEKQ